MYQQHSFEIGQKVKGTTPRGKEVKGHIVSIQRRSNGDWIYVEDKEGNTVATRVSLIKRSR